MILNRKMRKQGIVNGEELCKNYWQNRVIGLLYECIVNDFTIQMSCKSFYYINTSQMILLYKCSESQEKGFLVISNYCKHY